MPCAYRFEHVQFDYGGAFALSLPELEIPAGEITALIGPNGCGKSTLLNLLAFMAAPSSGTLKFFDQAVNTQQLAAYRQRIGYLPQKPYLLRGTVQDNLKLALKFQGISKKVWPHKIKDAAERVNIAHLLDQDASQLSGGELQKAALARALIHDPAVLLLDEPFAFLDQGGSQLVEKFMLSYHRDSRGTLIFSTHNRLQGLALAGEVISLINGEPTRSPLINLFRGQCTNHVFNTGRIEIILTSDIADCRQVSINPHEIVLSKSALVSSIRNRFPGRVTAIADELGRVRISVMAGEIFHALITYEALHDLDLHLGDPVWVNFKSNSVTAF
ncbi:MAG: ATP-binding cassette domain-containing protein [Gammaproteobacteria bacterium]